jgi:2-C-methyl-D-erythritol 4-phosphate cytidylyltransferase
VKDLVSLVLLAGGSGSRMQSEIPKQFLQLKNKGVVFHSLDIFRNIDEIDEIIVVTDDKWRPAFQEYKVVFASPGARRQDSLFNGLQKVSPETKWILVHDAARPLITEKMVRNLIEEGKTHGAATLGVPLKATVKEGNLDKLVARTLDRSLLWEIQTPQFVSKQILIDGFAIANRDNLTVTDDTSLAELCGKPVKLVFGSYSNLKITTPEDIALAHAFINS